MRRKIKVKINKIYTNEFLIFPRKFEKYRYWLCWATIEYNWLGWRYQRVGSVKAMGKHALKYNIEYVKNT